MIRRGFWMALGAALGVTAYRRVSRLARAVRPARRTLGGRHAVTSATAEFLHDVRDGMDEYLARHPGPQGHTLEGQQARVRPQSEPRGTRTYTGIDYAKDGR